jgi:hypothetical protein
MLPEAQVVPLDSIRNKTRDPAARLVSSTRIDSPGRITRMNLSR